VLEYAAERGVERSEDLLRDYWSHYTSFSIGGTLEIPLRRGRESDDPRRSTFFPLSGIGAVRCNLPQINGLADS